MKFIARSPIEYGRRHEVGSVIDLDEGDIGGLVACGAVDPRDAKLLQAMEGLRAEDPSTPPTVRALQAASSVRDVKAPERDTLWAALQSAG